MAKHNKKRNVGLLHEQIVRHASEMTVLKNREASNLAIDILVKNFSKDSALLREFRLFSSLVHTKVKTKELARRIIQESRRACAERDHTKLDTEKSILIKEINHKINRADFYHQPISQYRIFATVQTLLNEWRGASRLSPKEVIKYETVLEDHLTRSSKSENIEKVKDANPLVLNLMIEKFNKKYSRTLSSLQKELLEAKLSATSDEILLISKKIKESAFIAVNNYYSGCENKVLLEKQLKLEKTINSYKPGTSDASVAKALSLASLLNELEEKDV